jgi:ribosome-associated translation inhibitor RaiA
MFESGEVPISVETRGDVLDHERDEVVARLTKLARMAPRPVRMMRASLLHEQDPALQRPNVAKASIDVDGRIVRAHVAAPEMGQALAALEERLSRLLDELSGRDQAARVETGLPTPGEWRHGDVPTLRPHVFPRPPEERQIMRRKTYAFAPMSVEDAAWELRMLDHDFFLFTNLTSNEENVIYRGGDGVLHLRQLSPPGEAFVDPVVIDADPAPVLDEHDAVKAFDITEGGFLFYVDRDTGRGHVLYRRYDGHYGLISPAI